MGPPTLGWENFFVAEAGASAALTGLLFVAASIGLSRILTMPHLAGRALESLAVFLAVLAVATFGLVPGQPAAVLGCEIGATGAVLWAATTPRQLRAYRDRELHPIARRWIWLRVLWTQVAALAFVVAGVLLVLGRQHALYWVVPGTLASFAAGAVNAWVLMIEIQR